LAEEKTVSPEQHDLAPVLHEAGACVVTGDWSMQSLSAAGEIAARRRALARATPQTRWDLSALARLDTLGAHVLWRAWGSRLPEHITLSASHREIFTVLSGQPRAEVPRDDPDPLGWLVWLGAFLIEGGRHARALIEMLGHLVFDLGKFITHPTRGPWREISAQIFRIGAQALGITALVGFLIGVVLSYLSAQQLSTFGADRFLVRLLGASIVRELGPLLAAILVAGRSGSAITAQLGVMRLTQELDALRVMGISHSQRLILPRVVALAVAMPLLVLWTDAAALLGGMLAAQVTLGMTPQYFFGALPDAISQINYAIGMGKGVAFGVTIALIACHFGLRIEPNTTSLGRGTTQSVVTAITAVILVDAVFAIALAGVGLPGQG
jgi:phospholipid/cholesterol/gamma-HCH transport system permease protein